MSNSRALVTTPNLEQVVLEKISKLNQIHEQRIDGMVSLQELSGVPTFREIIQSKAFDLVRRKHSNIDVYELKERDVDLQRYILGRFLEQIKGCRNDLQRSQEYIHVIKAFDRYGIEASDYLSSLEDKTAKNEARDLIREAAASYVKLKLAEGFYIKTLSPDDRQILESDRSKPNDQLESLLRPFEDAVTYNRRTREYDKPQWFELLGVLEQAGWDFDERGLAEAIMPDNAYTNTLMEFDQPLSGTQPA